MGRFKRRGAAASAAKAAADAAATAAATAPAAEDTTPAAPAALDTSLDLDGAEDAAQLLGAPTNDSAADALEEADDLVDVGTADAAREPDPPANAAAAAAVDEPLEGRLSKLGDKGLGARLWKQLHVYVKDGRLVYAKKPGYRPARSPCCTRTTQADCGRSQTPGLCCNSATPSGTIPLDAVQAVTLHEQPAFKTNPKPKPGTCFDVVTASQAHHFMADVRRAGASGDGPGGSLAHACTRAAFARGAVRRRAERPPSGGSPPSTGCGQPRPCLRLLRPMPRCLGRHRCGLVSAPPLLS